MDQSASVDGAGTRVYRVTVRSRFRDLGPAARQYLVRAQSEHDIFRSAYTAEGTFTYDPRIMFFNLRYEVRIDASESADLDEASALAAVTAEVEAEAFLTTMGFGHDRLKTEVVDVSKVWESTRRH